MGVEDEERRGGGGQVTQISDMTFKIRSVTFSISRSANAVYDSLLILMYCPPSTDVG